MKTQRNYGDENSGYDVLAKSMSPEEAKSYLEQNIKDGIYVQMNEQRRIALRTRVGERK